MSHKPSCTVLYTSMFPPGEEKEDNEVMWTRATADASVGLVGSLVGDEAEEEDENAAVLSFNLDSSSSATEASGEEAGGRAAGPVRLMYLSHGLQTFGDRMWEFAVPILFMDVWPNTLLPSAIYMFVLYSATLLLMTSMGSWLDRTDRWTSISTALFGQNLCIAVTCALQFSVLDIVPQVTR